MNKRRVQCAGLLLGTVSLLAVVCGHLMPSRQDALNRQLIAALRMNDTQQAIVLVNMGADPNAPIQPVRPLSIRLLWDYLLHHPPTQLQNDDTAFSFACNGWVRNLDQVPIGENGDAPELVEAMLQHGANIMWNDTYGVTPLRGAIMAVHINTVFVLLEHGVDANASNAMDWFRSPALFEAVRSSKDSRDRMTRDVIPQLLAYGADPNLPDAHGVTPLQLAQQIHRPDLVALLRKVGAKK